MNRLLTELLTAAVAKIGTRGAGRWEHVTLVNSVGPVPLTEAARSGWQGDRGFNLLLDSGPGRPAYFGKCRDASDAGFARETELLERLSESPAGRAVLPPACGVRIGRARLQLSVYLTGTPLRRLLRTLSDRRWEHALDEVVLAADALSRAARDVFPDLVTNGDGLSLGAEGAAALRTLASAGAGPEVTETLQRILDAAPVIASRPQHGDLWASNVLRTRRGWILLDLEFFGMVRVPLYDAAQLVKTTSQDRTTPPDPWDAPKTPWSALLLNDTAEARVGRRVLAKAAAAAALPPAASVGCVLFYLTDATARLASQATPAGLLAPVLDDLAELVRAIRQGVAADRLLGFA